MEHGIGVFNMAPWALAIIVIVGIVAIVISTMLYNLREESTTLLGGNKSSSLLGPIVFQLIGIVMTLIALMSWWTTFAWDNGYAGLGVVVGSLVALFVSIVVPPVNTDLLG